MTFDLKTATEEALITWAKEAIEQYKEDAYRTGIEEEIERYHFVYSSYYVPFAMSKFHYEEGIETSKEPGYNGYKDNLIAFYQKEMREEAVRLDDVLPAKYRFGRFTPQG